MSVNTADDGKKKTLSWMRFKKMVFHLWRQFDDPYYAGFAAQVAYFFFMSSIPTLIVITQIAGLFDVSTDFIRAWLETHLSVQLNSFLEGLFSASSAAFPNILMMLLAIWAASSLAFSLSRLATYTLSNGKYRFNFFTERGKAIILAIISILTVVGSMVVYVYGEMIAHRIFRSEFAVRMIAHFKTPVLAALFFFVILANYYLLPRIRVPISAVLPGAILATLGILLVTWLFSLYTATAVNYNVLYGTFSNIVALMLWFYLMSWVLCIGMMFNRSWDIHMSRGRLSPEKIREYLVNQYGSNGEEMYDRLIIGDYDITNPKLDSIAVRVSRKLDPGYNEKREREIRELREEQIVRDRVETEIRNRIEQHIIEDANKTDRKDNQR